MSDQSLWVTPDEAAVILGLKDRNAVYHQIETGIIPQSALRPRNPRGPIRISRAHLTGATEPTSNILPFGRMIDMDELADKLLARMIANPALAKAVADVAMRPLFDQLMGKAS